MSSNPNYNSPHKIQVNSTSEHIEVLRNSKIFLGHSCILCCLSNWNARTKQLVDSPTSQRLSLLLCYSCFSEGGKNEQNNLKEYLSFGKKLSAGKWKYIHPKKSQIFHNFPIVWGRQLDIQPRDAFQFLKYCFLILVWDFG